MLLRNDTDVEQVFPTENVGARPGEVADLHWIAEGDPIPEGWSPAEVAPHPFAPPVTPITEVDPVAPTVAPHPFSPPPAADAADPSSTPQEG